MSLDPSRPIFLAAELDAYAPAVSGAAGNPGHGTRAHGTPADPSTPAVSRTIRASDVGYRTRSADPDGLQVYPPLLAAALQIDRAVNLDPTQSAAAGAWGSLSLSNASGAFDALAGASNSDGRTLRILAGQKAWEVARGIWLDPAYAALLPLFQGVAAPWTLNTQTLDVPVRDATYWLERPLQTSSYSGAGGLNGGADLTGKPLPKARGGTAQNPICNVSPVLVDSQNYIYQYTDGPGTVVSLYEGGYATWTYQGDVADLYSGSTNSGSYRTCNAKGLFQLGVPPVHQVTADVTGAFPQAGQQTTVTAIARYLMTEDLGLPAGSLYTDNLAQLDSLYPYQAGVYFGPQAMQGVDAVSQVLGSAGWKLFPRRDGTLMIRPLLDVSGQTPVASFDPSNAVSLAPQQLPANVMPPPFRLRVAYQRAWTVQTTDLSPSISAARRSLVSAQDRYAGWSSGDVLTAWRRPNDPDPIGACLLTQADAQAVANALGALWGVRRRLYALTLPATIGLLREIGDVVRITWPMDDLAQGRIGQIVGEQFRSGDATSTLQILV